ncbi:MAG: hypothetical protein KC468_31140 [Myxococcales bacterium]|nr:hypothetical protein [Myxococcales bacterium]
MLATLLAIFALLALVLTLRTRRFATPILALVIGFAATGCDGCSPHSSPGPLRPDENTRFYVSDRLGSSALVTDLEGRVLAREVTTPYGEPWISWQAEGAQRPDYVFTGNEREPLDNDIAIGARHYMPATGRWTSPDPLFLLKPGHTLELAGERNPYRYAANDPVTMVRFTPSPPTSGVERPWSARLSTSSGNP